MSNFDLKNYLSNNPLLEGDDVFDGNNYFEKFSLEALKGIRDKYQGKKMKPETKEAYDQILAAIAKMEKPSRKSKAPFKEGDGEWTEADCLSLPPEQQQYCLDNLAWDVRRYEAKETNSMNEADGGAEIEYTVDIKEQPGTTKIGNVDQYIRTTQAMGKLPVTITFKDRKEVNKVKSSGVKDDFGRPFPGM